MKSHALKIAFAPVVVAAALLLWPSASFADTYPQFYLNLNVVNTDDITNGVIFTSNPTEGTAAGQYDFFAPASINNGIGGVYKGPVSDTNVFVIGIYHPVLETLETLSDGLVSFGGLALFTNATFAASAIGGEFDALFSGYDETTLIDELRNETVPGDVDLNNFASAFIDIIGFKPGDAFSITNFSIGSPGGDGTSSFALVATPLPAALPLFAGGLGAIGLLARRKKRKQAAA